MDEDNDFQMEWDYDDLNEWGQQESFEDAVAEANDAWE